MVKLTLSLGQAERLDSIPDDVKRVGFKTDRANNVSAIFRSRKRPAEREIPIGPVELGPAKYIDACDVSAARLKKTFRNEELAAGRREIHLETKAHRLARHIRDLVEKILQKIGLTKIKLEKKDDV